MIYQIKNHHTDAVMFAVELPPDVATQSESIQCGFAVRKALGLPTGLVHATLTGANFVNANLAGANLACAKLGGANFANANLAGAKLGGANLTGANFTGAYLAGANLTLANIAGANLAGAYLAGANLADANLVGADLAHAYLTSANLACTKGVIDAGLRSDGFRFVGCLTPDGALRVLAGCRYLSAAKARQHWKTTRGATQLGAESLALVDHIERMADILGWPKITEVEAA
jgi:hypothetical protein